jgi:methionyl-tRNA formyltransferase
MQLEAGLDTGPVFACERTAIDESETAGELRARLGILGVRMLLEHLPEVARREPAPQVGESTTAAKLTVEEFRIDPTRDAAALARLVRAGNPRPGAWALAGERRVKVLRAHVERAPASGATAAIDPVGTVDRFGRLVTASGPLVLDEVAPEGRPVMSGAAWRAGHHGAELALS